MHNLPIFIIVMSLAAGLALAVVTVLAAVMFLHPPRMSDGKAIYLLRRLLPTDLGLAYAPLTLEVSDSASGGRIKLAAWWIPADPTAPSAVAVSPADRCAVLIHGLADAKVGAIAWAPLFHRLGWNVLALDLRAHGNSGGRQCTFGFHERHDVDQALNQVQAQFPEQTRRVVLLGLSLGGAVAVATAALRDDVTGVIVDSLIPSFQMASWQHLRLLRYDLRPLHWLAVKVAAHLSHADFEAVAPIRILDQVQCPILAIDGADDPLLAPPLRQALADAYARRRQRGLATEVWSVAGAGHLEAYASVTREYESRVEAWLNSIAAGSGRQPSDDRGQDPAQP